MSDEENCLESEVIKLRDEISRLREENKRLQMTISRLESQVHIDPLTGALNKRGIGDLLEAEVGYARRTGTPLSLIFLDIDFFKRINDEMGHLTGDAILRELVSRLQGTLRRYDKVGRFGGEEFLVVLRNTDLKRAEIVANRLREITANKPFKYINKEIIVTISLGVAERQPTEMAFSLIGAADDVMRQAKKEGRNRVVVNKRDGLPID